MWHLDFSVPRPRAQQIRAKGVGAAMHIWRRSIWPNTLSASRVPVTVLLHRQKQARRALPQVLEK
jgi:hypothetical protein